MWREGGGYGGELVLNGFFIVCWCVAYSNMPHKRVRSALRRAKQKDSAKKRAKKKYGEAKDKIQKKGHKTLYGLELTDADKRKKYQDARSQAERDRIKKEAREKARKQAREEFRKKHTQRLKKQYKEQEMKQLAGKTGLSAKVARLGKRAVKSAAKAEQKRAQTRRSSPSQTRAEPAPDVDIDAKFAGGSGMGGPSRGGGGGGPTRAFPLDTDSDGDIDEWLVGLDNNQNGQIENDEWYQVNNRDKADEKLIGALGGRPRSTAKTESGSRPSLDEQFAGSGGGGSVGNSKQSRSGPSLEEQFMGSENTKNGEKDDRSSDEEFFFG